MRDLVVFDLETTGLDKTKDHIIQFAAIKVSSTDADGNITSPRIVDSINLYIRPEGMFQISVAAYMKHGISAKMLEDKPLMKDVAKDIVEFIDKCDLLTFNGCSFDIPFLASSLARVGFTYDFLSVDCYDSFLEEKRRNGNDLGSTFKRYIGHTMDEHGLRAHDALSDVKATFEIFKMQQEKKKFGPEEILCEDNVITMQEFQSEVVPCFNIGKYKNISLKLVKKIDTSYLKWVLSDTCQFSESAKDLVRRELSC